MVSITACRSIQPGKIEPHIVTSVDFRRRAFVVSVVSGLKSLDRDFAAFGDARAYASSIARFHRWEIWGLADDWLDWKWD